MHIDRERWPDYVHSSQPESAEQQRSTVQTIPTHRHNKHCSTPGCDGTGHKNVARWSEGHTTRAGCPIYHNVDAP